MSAPNWFVAFEVVAPRAIEALGPPPLHVRLFAPEDLHATIAFFGAVDEDAARAGWAALRLDVTPRTLRLGPVVPLGPPARPSALSARIDDAELTRAIGSARDAALQAAGAPLDPRPPLAHVTLARIGRRASDRERADAIAWAAARSLAGLAARTDRVALYTWSADRHARLFRIVDARALA